MSTWSPDAQTHSLKYGAYVSLVSGIYFTIMLANKWVEYAGFETGNLPNVLLVLVALLFVGIVSRMSIKNHKLCGGWREILGIYNDEYTREVNRKASNRAFVGLIATLIPGFIIGEKWAETTVGSYLNVSTYSLLLIVVGTFVWAITVLWELREQGEQRHG